MAEIAARPACLYRPRRVRDSALYRLAEEHLETFKQVYDDRFASRYGFWRADRTLLGDLARCAWGTVRDLYLAGLPKRTAVPGMVASVQTYGDLANWNPRS